ncbi:MAG: ABC1 kinase family protein [Bacillota bacterium]
MSFGRGEVLRRYRTVLRVLSRYGFGYLAGAVGLGGLAPAGPAGRGSRGERLRAALQELGPAFVKLGQMLSIRSDLLPPDVIASLERLQDQVEPVPFEAIRSVLEEEFGGPLEGRFRQVERVPLAAASLGQVHAAVLPDGQQVVLKVQRPGVAEQVELDLHVMLALADLAHRRTRFGRRYQLPAIAREFAAMLRAELDYVQEGQNADRFRANFAGDETVRFPQVYWEHTTPRVLTLERVGGLRVVDGAELRVVDGAELREAGIEPGVLAGRLAGALFKMAMRDGFFHADPHPGNLFVEPDGTLVFVDMGMVGELTPAMRDHVVEYVVGVVTNDPDRVVEAILHMGMLSRIRRRAELRVEVERLQRKYGELPLKEIEVVPALREMMDLVRRFEIGFPTGYAVLLKAMTTLEAVARRIDPNATLVGLAAPYAEEVLIERLHPERLLRRGGREIMETGRHLLRIPRQVSRLLTLAEEGELRLPVDLTGLEPSLRRLSAIANRLAIAILLASLIIGTALVASRAERSLLQRYPIADTGFILIGAVGVWLVWSILAGHMKG